MPRMLPRHKYADYMVVSAGYAEQDLASSHNMITIRPRPWTWPKGAHIVFRDDGDMALIGPRLNARLFAPSSRSAFTAGTITL